MSKLQVDSVDEVTSANGVTIDGLNIKDSKLTTANSVVTTNITDANVTTAKITDANVTTAKIADANVTTAKIADANVTTAKIADANVTTAKIADANITVAKMAANSVDSNQYVDGSIDTAHIANDQITNALMADNAIDTAQIAASAVETAKINDDAVTLAKMAPGTDGNIISFDASGNPVAVATGSAGQVLTSAGAGAPPTFAASAVGGKVLQVVQGVLNAEQATTATSMTATSLNVDITPSASSSKILVMMSGPVYMNSSDVYYRGTIYRDSTNLSTNGNMASTRNNGSSIGCSFSINVLDSPSSTSQLTYKYYHRIDSGSGATGYISINDWTSTIIALEIGA